VFALVMSSLSKPYEYVLYIDEAGDDGLKRVRPIDGAGATEWGSVANFWDLSFVG
jgi:hypothetical protein